MSILFLSIGITVDATARSRAEDNLGPQFSTGTVGFAKQIIATGIDETHAVVTADWDGDGDIDAAATDYIDGQVLWFENDGTHNFTSHILDPALEGAYPMSVADLDGDLDMDILAAGYLADTYVWYENLGAGAFTRHDIDTAADGPHSLVAWDPDQDGDQDLLVANQDDSSVVWYENDGTQSFTPRVIDDDFFWAKRAEAADFDDDDDLDVVACSPGSDEVAWYENDGNENFTKHSITHLADWAYFVLPADLDNDGDQDVAGVSQNDNSVSWYRNDGTGNFTAFDIATTAMGARMVQAADLDGDSDLDLVTSSVDDNTVGWYENDGTGTFVEHEVDDLALGAYGVWTVDMDGDGAIDVLSANRDANNVSLNWQIGAHWASLSDLGATLPISESMLQATDPDNTPAELTYSLTTAPQVGVLRVFGAMLNPGDTFTQADINAGGLAYVHDGSPLTAVDFDFTVTDGGGPPIAGTFRITIGDGELSHWPLNETSGLIAGDVTGDNDGTLVNGPIWRPSAGYNDGALEFDGVDDRVALGPLEVGGGDGLTVTMWIKPTELNGGGRLISKATGTAEQDHYWMVGAASLTQLRFRLKSGGVTSTLIAPPPVLVVGEWLHVACTYDGAGMRIYGNGVLLGSQPKVGPLDGSPLVDAAIGNQPTGAGTDGFSGLIDEVHIFNRALSIPEIAAVMATGGLSAVGGDDRSLIGLRAGQLHGNTPNPFNPKTSIRFDVHRAGMVILEVFNLRGQRLRQLVAGHMEPGSHTTMWDGLDRTGRAVASGTYLYRLQIGREIQVRRMMLVR